MRVYYDRFWGQNHFTVIGARTCGMGSSLREAQHDARNRTPEARGKDRKRRRRLNVKRW